MSFRRIIRFASSTITLSGIAILAVDQAFLLTCPTMRGTPLYAVFQILFQVALGTLMAKRVIIIFC